MLASAMTPVLMTNLTDALHIPDTQSARDERHIAIQRVGVKDVRYPLQLGGRRHGAATTAASWTLDVALPAEQQGHAHVALRRLAGRRRRSTRRSTPPRCAAAHAAMLDRLQASEGRVEARFDFFLRKRAPVSGVQSLLDYQGRWIAETRAGATALWAEVGVPVKSLCPCSKEISDYGAHNQRSLVTIRVELLPSRSTGSSWCALPRTAASSEIWPLLKRPDEKWITERAYENPKFVEDLVRDVALKLNERRARRAATSSKSRTSSRFTTTALTRASSARKRSSRSGRLHRRNGGGYAGIVADLDRRVALVGADQTAARHRPLVQRAEHFIAARRGRERGAGPEREHLERIAVRAMTRRRIGRQPAALQIRVAAGLQAVAFVIRALQCALGESAVAGLEIDHDCVYQRLRRRRIGIFDKQQNRCRLGGHAAAQRNGGDTASPSAV